MSNVLLLRARSQDQTDPYEQSLRDAGYNPLCVPILETVFHNLDELKRTIVHGPRERGLAGVIITSARACEAWRDVVKELVKGDRSSGNYSDWSNVPFYVVGETTSLALSLIETNYGNSFVSKDIRGGSQTGKAESLAHFILKDLQDHDGAKMLYLTGDKNRDTLPKILAEGHVNLQTLQVYETRGSSSFPQDIKSALESRPEPNEWWIVFFAPSTAEFVMPTLRSLFNLPSFHNAGATDGGRQPELAAIGPTTYDLLRGKLGLRVAVCSEHPTPESLTAGISQFNQK